MADQRGGAFYDIPEVHSRYRAHRNDERLSPHHLMEEPAVWAEIGDACGLRVLDLGCGDGGFGRQLLAAGARSYLGIDGSHRMADLAAAALAGTAGQVRRADLEEFVPEQRSVELITARLSLHYVADLGSLMRSACRALVPSGRFLVTVVHPVITSHDSRPEGPRTDWTVDDYFVPGARRRTWLTSEVTWHHRTVEEYFAAMTGNGLTVTSLRECEPVPARFDDRAELARRRRVPLFLLLNGRL